MFYMFLCLYYLTSILGHYLHKLDKSISLFSSFYLLQLKSNKRVPNMEKIQKIKALNKDLKTYYHTVKSKNVRRNVMPGNSASLWKAVKIAKDQNVSTMFNVIKFCVGIFCKF